MTTSFETVSNFSLTYHIVSTPNASLSSPIISKEYGNNRLWPILRSCHRIYRQELKKAHDKLYSWRYSNWKPLSPMPECQYQYIDAQCDFMGDLLTPRQKQVIAPCLHGLYDVMTQNMKTFSLHNLWRSKALLTLQYSDQWGMVSWCDDAINYNL
jgi:hypothetical protein